MAHCVESTILDTDGDRFVSACVVHTHHAPCPRDGEPANPAPLHVWSERRAGSVREWAIRTDRQRPLIIHNGSPADATEHQIDGTAECWCGPEVIEPPA
jgi:hypothetical protein